MNRTFKAEMIAPCGLDCNICKKALAEVDPCPGCNGPDINKPEYCSKVCGIMLCQKRRDNGYRYCDECPDYPCEDVMEKENRYAVKYAHTESPIANLRTIREEGMETFLKRQQERWTCPYCGNIFSVYERECPNCGKEIFLESDR